MSTAADIDGEFADFTSFQATSLPHLTSQSSTGSRPVTERNGNTVGELSLSTDCLPAFSQSVSGNTSSVAPGKETSDKYLMIKELISDPSLFTSGPTPTSDLTTERNSMWLDYQGPSSANTVQSGVQNCLATDLHPSLPHDDGKWADFKGTSDSSEAICAFHDAAPHFDMDRVPVKTKVSTVANNSNAASWFGIQQNNPIHSKPGYALFSSGALDLSPPELPAENDDDDAHELGFYSGHAADVDRGISSLSTLDLEDEPVDLVGSDSGRFSKSGVRGMTTSDSTSSFEFTGWQQGSKHRLPVPSSDTQSTSSLDLRPPTDAVNRSPSHSPSQPSAEADSQSESSFEFVPPTETRSVPPSSISRADFDTTSLQSLELKTTAVSPKEESSSDTAKVTGQSLGGFDNAPASNGMPTSLHYLISLQLLCSFNFYYECTC